MVSSPKAVGECDLVYFPKVHRCHRNGAGHGDAIKQEELCEALRCYTHNRAYRLRLIAGATRNDLNGQPAGFVTKKQEARRPKKRSNLRRQKPAPKEAPATPTNRMSLADLREAAR